MNPATAPCFAATVPDAADFPTRSASRSARLAASPSSMSPLNAVARTAFTPSTSALPFGNSPATASPSPISATC